MCKTKRSSWFLDSALQAPSKQDSTLLELLGWSLSSGLHSVLLRLSGVDSKLLGPPELHSKLLEPSGLDSGLLGPPGLDSGLLGSCKVKRSS